MNARYLIWAAVITLIRQSGFYFLQCVRGPFQGYSGKCEDDITNQVLNGKLMMVARATGLEYFNSKGLWRKHPRQEAFT